jgi:Putative DNA-binding domain
MKYTDQFILDLISQGENEKVEFKSRLINENDFARVLTAFANTSGGYLLVGVLDNGQIVGLSDEEASLTARRLTKICTSIFTGFFEVRVINLSGKNIVLAHIEKAPENSDVITTGSGEYFVRQGSFNLKTTIKPTRFYGGGKALKKKGESIIGFVAMSFRIEEEPALIDYFNAMKRAAERTELPVQLIRIDLTDGDFEISKQIMDEIKKSDFVLVDFTLSPHNVYFEIGFARGMDKRIIQTAKKETVLQFDVRNWSTLFYRNATELEEKLIPKFIAVYDEVTI